MLALLYANVATKVLSDTLSGSAYQFPVIIAGEHLLLKIRPAERLGNASVRSSRQIHGFTTTIGHQDARPESGSYSLKIGSATSVVGTNVTTALAWNATAEQLQAALNALTLLSGASVTCKVTLLDGTYAIKFSDGTERTITAQDNVLWPQAYVLVDTRTESGAVIHDLRLTQAALAQTTLHVMRNASVPTVEEVQVGATNSEVKTPAIQKLNIPAEFDDGSFILTRGVRKTAPISVPFDDTDVLATALEALADDDGEFAVTVEEDAFLIRFEGSMSGVDQDLLGVTVLTGPQPHAEIVLDTKTSAMGVRLRRLVNGELTIPLDIEMRMVDPRDEESYHVTTFRQEVKIKPPVASAAHNVSADIDWTKPLSLADYKPFSPDQIVVGNVSSQHTIGNGSATSFTLNHNLNASLLHVTVREAASPGAKIEESAYNISFISNNALVITPSSVLASNAWSVAITTANAVAAFLAHTHEDDEVPGHEARISALEAQVAELLANASSGSFSTSEETPGEQRMIWRLDEFVEAWPRRLTAQQLAALQGIGDLRKLEAAVTRRAGGLLPAVHDAAAESLVSFGNPVTVTANASTNKLLRDNHGLSNGALFRLSTTGTLPGGTAAATDYYVVNAGDDDLQLATTPGGSAIDLTDTGSGTHSLLLPVAPTWPTDITLKAKVFVNNDIVTHRIPGSLQRKGVDLAPGEHCATDGLGHWYKVAKYDATKTTWYPTDFDRELFEFVVRQEMQPVGHTLLVDIGLELLMALSKRVNWQAHTANKNRAAAQWLLVIERGTITAATTPSTPGQNIAGITWDTAHPLLSQVLNITTTPVPHWFGLQISRAADGMTAKKKLYSTLSAADHPAPTDFPYALRGRLVCFDTADSTADPRGIVLLAGLDRDHTKSNRTNDERGRGVIVKTSSLV
ncbi:MAG: hypothetical protein JNJ83_10925 [Verrucomicrobiaceae bacterium]|nr:hypothetical protein [Verrucomicrobiaceae bacterium]